MRFMDLAEMIKSLLAPEMIPFMPAMETIISNQELETIRYMAKEEMTLFTYQLVPISRMVERA